MPSVRTQQKPGLPRSNHNAHAGAGRNSGATAGLAALGLALMLITGISPTAAQAQSAAAPPLVVAHNMVNAWNALDVPAIAGLFAEDGRFQSMMSDEVIIGRSAIEARFTALLGGATRLELQLRNIAASGDTVFLERVDVFTYKGKDGIVPVVAVLDIRNGKVQEWREYYDRASLLREMGLEEGQQH